MAVTAQQIMVSAGRILQDESAARWTLPELLSWLNEGVSAIVLALPDASSKTITMSLVAGTWQQLATQYLSLLRITRNISAAGPPPVGGRAVRVTSRESLDTVNPNWHNPKCIKYTAEVRQFVYDGDDPLSFYVYPGNDGTGMIEAIVSELPAAIAATGDINTIGSYAVAIGLKDTYQTPLLDFVLYRAFSKDDTAGNAPISQQHYQAFATALGIKTKVASSVNPKAPAQPAPGGAA